MSKITVNVTIAVETTRLDVNENITVQALKGEIAHRCPNAFPVERQSLVFGGNRLKPEDSSKTLVTLGVSNEAFITVVAMYVFSPVFFFFFFFFLNRITNDQ